MSFAPNEDELFENFEYREIEEKALPKAFKRQMQTKEVDAFSEQVETSIADGDSMLSISHQVRHEVAVPVGYDYVPLNKHVPSEKPAREYSFKLDPFQRAAISCIERDESVLVSAHTSAGKTVVAE